MVLHLLLENDKTGIRWGPKYMVGALQHNILVILHCSLDNENLSTASPGGLGWRLTSIMARLGNPWSLSIPLPSDDSGSSYQPSSDSDQGSDL